MGKGQGYGSGVQGVTLSPGCPQAPTKGTACSQPQHHALAQRVEELQERLDEESKVRLLGGGGCPLRMAAMVTTVPPMQLRQKLELTKERSTTRALEEAQEESARLRAALEKRMQELQRSSKE